MHKNRLQFMMDIDDDDTLEYLDNVAAIVASLLEFDKEKTKK